VSAHLCHVPTCGVETPPNMFMCWAHWAMVPLPLKNKIWIEFKEEQVTTKKPSAAYLKAAKEALDAVNEKLVGPPTVQGELFG